MALYASVTSDGAFATVLELLARRFRCPSASLVYVDPVRPEAQVAVGHGVLDAAVQARYRAEFAALDPAPGAMAKIEIGTAITTDRLFTPEQKAQCRFFREFYVPLGLVETMGAPIVNDDGQFGIIAIQRGADRPPFDDAELSAFERLTAHIRQAIELRRAFFAIQTHASSLADAVDAVTAAIMILSPAGGLTHANRRAREILDRRDGFGLNRAGRLSASDAATNRRIASLFSSQPPHLPLILRVPRHHASSPYLTRISRLNGEPVLTIERASGVLLTTHDPDGDPGDVGGLLEVAFGLRHRVHGWWRPF